MQYLAWRVLVGLHRTITISFLIVGHTKFSPDWCFGLFKQKFRRTKVSCLDDIVRVVEGSAEVNHAQLVATQSNDVLVPTYNWSQFFEQHFRNTAFAGIKSYHHFHFDANTPGVVHVQTASDQPQKAIKVLQDPSWKPSPSELPDIVPPAGLSLDRQWYLYEKIREFCNPDVQDLVCPKPTGNYPKKSDSDQTRSEQQDSMEPAPKKPRLCSNCRKGGHNRRSCPDLAQ